MDKETLRKVQMAELEVGIEFKRICDELHLDYFLDAGTLLGAVRHKGFIPWDDDMDFGMLRKDYITFLEKAPSVINSEKFFLQTMYNDRYYGVAFSKLRKKNTVYVESLAQDAKSETGFFVDIFPYDVLPDDEEKRKTQGKQHGLYRRMLLSKSGYHVWLTSGAGKAGTFIRKIAYKIAAVPLAFVSKKAIVRKFDEICMRYNNEESEMFYAQSGCRGYGEWAVSRDCFKSFAEMPFETETFKCPEDSDLYLKTIYHDYMKLPPEDQRENRHQIIELKF